MDAALHQLKAEGYPVRTADVARLTPLRWGHMNMLGRYAFTLPDAVARGELRPLRHPTAPVDELWGDLPSPGFLGRCSPKPLMLSAVAPWRGGIAGVLPLLW